MKTIIGILFLIVLVSGCTFPEINIPINTNFTYPDFIKNASHGMEIEMNPGDVMLVGRAGYYKEINGDKYSVILCEECGIDNDCLQNNLNSIKNYKSSDENVTMEIRSMTQKDLIFFYVYPITYEEVKSQHKENEAFDTTYSRVFENKCNISFLQKIEELIK